MRGRCGIKVSKGGQMIKHSRWKGTDGVGVKIKEQEDDGIVSKTMNEMGNQES